MNRIWRFLSAALFMAQALLVGNLNAQEAELNYDFAFESRISEVWAKVRETDEDTARDIQEAFAQESFDYYRQHPSTTTGGHAADAAFRMWGNLAAVNEVEKALPFLRGDFLWWGLILPSVQSAYFQSGQPDAFFELLLHLETDLTHARAQSDILLHLGRLFLGKQQNEEALSRFRKIVALDTDSPVAVMAQGYLHEFENLAVGQAAPEFTATTLEGNALTLSDLRGQVVLLEFWATWCAPCLPEIPNLKRLDNEYRVDGLRIVGVSLDMSLGTLRRFITDEEMGWPQVQVEIQGQIPQLFNAQSIPRSFLLDRQGRIAAKDVRGQNLEAAIKELMENTAN